MSEKIIITTFTDPMMGLSWECEPIFRKLETHFTGQIEFRTVMALLVRNVRDFMTPDELALKPVEGIRRYNARLAKIYESEEPISGMPINMTKFCLFSMEQPSSLPLNLAYHAARLTGADKADWFLYNLRYATIVDCRPTTETDELVNVAKTTGIDADAFARHLRDGSAEAALSKDLRLTQSMGIHSLPAYLLQYGGKAMLLRSFDYQDFASVISQLTNGTRKPQSAAPTGETLREFLREHPLISFIELREAFDFADTETVRELVQPLIERGEVNIEEAYHGWFVKVKP
ncbi:MAG: DsbA family protein [Clostridia bacterium]|nr:DsbA family protein [Clostridia bacterium]